LNLNCGNLAERFSHCAKELNSTFDQSVTTDMIAHTWAAPYDGWIQLRVTGSEGTHSFFATNLEWTARIWVSSFPASQKSSSSFPTPTFLRKAVLGCL
jgi:hypothetical protein